MNQLPDRLDIVGEVERPILEIRPAGIGRPGADQEEQARERGNDYLARLNRLPLSCDHLETAASIRFWMGPFCIWNRAINSVAEGRDWHSWFEADFFKQLRESWVRTQFIQTG